MSIVSRVIRATWREWLTGRIRREHAISWYEWKCEIERRVTFARISEAFESTSRVGIINRKLFAGDTDTGADT